MFLHDFDKTEVTNWVLGLQYHEYIDVPYWKKGYVDGATLMLIGGIDRSEVVPRPPLFDARRFEHTGVPPSLWARFFVDIGRLHAELRSNHLELQDMS